MLNPIYATDIDKGIRTDGFFGEGFEEMVAVAEAQGKMVIVGHYIEKPKVEE